MKKRKQLSLLFLALVTLFLSACQSARMQTSPRYQVTKATPQPELLEQLETKTPEVDTTAQEKPVVEQDPKHNKIDKPEAIIENPADRYKRKEGDIRIVLTFDDGPHATNNFDNSLTMRIAKTLKDGRLNSVQNNIKAAFFMQMGVSYRGGSDAGLKVLSGLNKQQHVVAIHTGSADGGVRNSGDHIDHTLRARQGKLDRDMKSAIQRLNRIGINSRWVRPVGGNYNNQVLSIYQFKVDQKLVCKFMVKR